jgi:hypothetical protein
VRAVCSDLTAFAYATDHYNLIVASSTLHFLRPTQLWRVADSVVAALARGGVFMAEVFTVDDPGFGVRRGAALEVEPNTFLLESGEPLHYFGRGELRRVFANLEELEYEEARRSDPASDSGFRAGATIVARKPG